MVIGPYELENPLILAPMAGVTDRPFRTLCRQFGAGLAVSEMLSSNPRVWASTKSQQRMNHRGESGVRSVQIAGACPKLMAQAAQVNVDNGAQIIDINMGCPAKKVNKKLAGSALMRTPELVKQILCAVVEAVEVPVTLKIRTGWDLNHRNAVEIAELAQQAGIAALAIHGRTRDCMYKGQAEYETIAQVKRAIDIPVIANGDINSPQQAKRVFDHTGVDAIMIGRGAQGNPWLFREISHFLATGGYLSKPSLSEVRDVVLTHTNDLYEFYGVQQGVRIARKHVGWYAGNHAVKEEFRRDFNQLETASAQTAAINHFFN